jgi:hypothetical protein
MRVSFAAAVLLLCTTLALAGISCGHCGALNSDSAGHCMMCGHAIGSQKPPRGAEPPEPAPRETPVPPDAATPRHEAALTPESRRSRRTERSTARPTRRQRRALLREQEEANIRRQRPPERRPPPPPAPISRGTLVIDLSQTGDAMMASSFSVALDGAPAGQGQIKGGLLHSGMARTYHYERSVPAGVHTVRLTLMGVRSDLIERPGFHRDGRGGPDGAPQPFLERRHPGFRSLEAHETRPRVPCPARA